VTLIKICGLTRAEDVALAEELGADFVGFVFVPESPRYVAPARAPASSRAKRVGVFRDASVDEIRRAIDVARLDVVQMHFRDAPWPMSSRASVEGPGRAGHEDRPFRTPSHLDSASHDTPLIRPSATFSPRQGEKGLKGRALPVPSPRLRGEGQGEGFVNPLDISPQNAVPARDDIGSAVALNVPVIHAFRVEDALPNTETQADYVLFDTGGGTGRTFDWSLLDAYPRTKPFFLAGGITPDNIDAALRVHPDGIDLASGVESAPGIKDHQKLRALFSRIDR
jgi:phosphoribosylanthranilate isomerase